MLLDDGLDTQHLAVLGFSTHAEQDALERLLPKPECSLSGSVGRDDSGEVPHHRVSTLHNAVGATCADKDKKDPSFLKRKKTLSRRKLTKHSDYSKGHVSSEALSDPSNVRTTLSTLSKHSPASLPHPAGFTADELGVAAELLPSLRELVHVKLLRPLTECLTLTSLTRIQSLSWAPVADRTRDVLIRSETGSGKTLAYALPLLHQLLCECDKSPIQRHVGTIIIVLCPTRELVLQVTDVFNILTRCALFLTVGGIYGGENRHKEKARLRKGLPILIATPGRLLDHLKATSSFCVDRMQTLVLDEADRLLDMGFEQTIKDVMRILLDKTENRRRACCEAPETNNEEYSFKRILVSATITAALERLSHFALRRNVVRVGETQDTFHVPSLLRQHYTLVPIKHRLATLISFLSSQLDAGAKKIIVFVSTADSAEFHYCLFSRLKSPFFRRANKGNNSHYGVSGQRARRYSVKKLTEEANRHVNYGTDDVVTFDDASESEGEDEALSLSDTNAFFDANMFKLHGNMSQVDRASVFSAFKQVDDTTQGSAKGVLLCTDVAARGLDMPRVDWIVHYDPPTDPACYVHRIGRTARIGNVGDSVLFLMPHEAEYVSYLSNFIAKKNNLPNAGHSSNLSLVMEEKKYESFLFYLTKLDPKSNHMWMQSTATLERAISHLVMGREGSQQEVYDEGGARNDDLTRLALFAYQSYIRAYAGYPRELKKLCFNTDALHLGHVAQSFGVDKKPSEVRARLLGLIREDRKVARDACSFTAEEGGKVEGSRPRRRLRVEVSHDDRYRSMVVQKQRRVTRDWYERKKHSASTHKALQFTEFDA